MMQRPCVLVCAGLDPSGGAGLAADIGAIAAQGAHALPALTVLTVQDNDRVHAIAPLPAAQVLAQIDALRAKIPFSVIKLGILGSLEIAQALAARITEWRAQQPDLQVVLDPVLASGAGDALAAQDPCRILAPLLPVSDVLLPNLPEAARLAQALQPGVAADAAAQAQAILQSGCRQLLLKGGHAEGGMVENHWFDASGWRRQWQWPRLHGAFHGSGCTLAAALAARLALGERMEAALLAAQTYTQCALGLAYPVADGQWIPARQLPATRFV
ncbi:hydroxymethylpyrimidine/phosphomethylpyrimidine kinase [Massilia sp. W12]|uniref:bifunctional hydroxymethylpyrimidine kinase/phosphomethylpyrimidine kinase n=1 Tax=Massilia sp. W12 TaxID=3126507 RepID=UPI0030CC7B35